MAYTAYLNTVEKIYLSYLQRPADPEGLVYWATKLDAAGGDLNAILPFIAASTECQTLYGTIDSAHLAGVLNQIYNGLFGRSPDAGGLAFWTDQFNKGIVTPTNLEITILNAAVIGGGPDGTTVANKLTAGTLFTSTIDPGLDNVNVLAKYPDNIPLNDLTKNIIKEIDSLSPFGADNPRPILSSRNLTVKDGPRQIGKNGFKLWLTDNHTTCEAVSFGRSALNAPKPGSGIDVAYIPSINDWQGVQSIQLELRDIK